MSPDPDINTYMVKAEKEESWKDFKSPLLITVAIIGFFIFITQGQIYQKITGLLTSISSLLPLLNDFLRNNLKQSKPDNT